MHDIMRTCLAVLFGLALTATGIFSAIRRRSSLHATTPKALVLDPIIGKMATAPDYGWTLTCGDATGAPLYDRHIHGWGPRTPSTALQ